MQVLVQFSIFLINKPGVLSQIFRELADAKVNIDTICLMDSTEHGVLRMVLDEPELARRVLRTLNIPITETEVLGVELPNRPGAVADVCDRLHAAHVNIGYLYCTSGIGKGGKTMVVLKVPDIKKAMKILEVPKNNRDNMQVKRKIRHPSRPAPIRR